MFYFRSCCLQESVSEPPDPKETAWNAPSSRPRRRCWTRRRLKLQSRRGSAVRFIVKSLTVYNAFYHCCYLLECIGGCTWLFKCPWQLLSANLWFLLGQLNSIVRDRFLTLTSSGQSLKQRPLSTEEDTETTVRQDAHMSRMTTTSTTENTNTEIHRKITYKSASGVRTVTNHSRERERLNLYELRLSVPQMIFHSIESSCPCARWVWTRRPGEGGTRGQD